jgi:hypothetical protein
MSTRQKVIQDLIPVLKEMEEDVNLFAWLLEDGNSRSDPEDVIDRYHACLKVHMQAITHLKRKLKTCKTEIESKE